MASCISAATNKDVRKRIKTIKSFFEDDFLCDFSIFVDDGVMRCHKLILSAASDYFRDWFLSDAQCSSLKLTDFKRHELEAILNFVYLEEFVLIDEIDRKELVAKAQRIGIIIAPKCFIKPRVSIGNHHGGSKSSLTAIENVTLGYSDQSVGELMPPPSEIPLKRRKTKAKTEANDDEATGVSNDDYSDTGDGDDDLMLLPFSQVIPEAVSTYTSAEAETQEFTSIRKKPFRCTVEACGHRFSSRRELENHKHRYHSKKLFTCAVCGKKYDKGKCYAEHMRKEHSNYIVSRYKDKIAKENTQQTISNASTTINETKTEDETAKMDPYKFDTQPVSQSF